ncbi:MAG TPA: PilT/PilU family type 4a pilus ATPase [Candidatus Polarisedimenticolaceae bacterium]|nr:PilT/PilU family type 4a pilus ATPase [Candidatus Polarisedimenticolaceae bacterium]
MSVTESPDAAGPVESAAAPQLDDLLRFTVEHRASDLHLKPMRPPLIRLGGKLLPLKLEPLQPDVIVRMLDRVLTERQRAVLDSKLAVDFGYSLAGVSRFRGTIFVQRSTKSAVFRRVPFDFPSLDEWGLPAILREFCKLPQGLVLLTGPTGSGKSSTLAAMMRLIADTRLVHIVTVEDPIEFLMRDNLGAVTQREVGTDTPSFALALRNALRQDPDVIMVGEMRDPATIQTVLTAAETGHLVFSTVHTNSAAQTVDRIIDSFPAGNHRQIRQQLSSVLEAVVSLKLVERTDGNGLIAAVEILRRTPRVAKLIFEGNLDGLEEEMEKSVAYEKMQTMNQSLAALVLHRVVTLETALNASTNPGDLDLALRKFLFSAAEAQGTEDGSMAEPLSDFSKILELQEIKRLYDELQERQGADLSERDEEITRLRAELAQHSVHSDTESGEVAVLKQENERLSRQIQLLRQEYDAKIERLNGRIRELSGPAPKSAPQAAGPAEPAERRGFFRR